MAASQSFPTDHVVPGGGAAFPDTPRPLTRVEPVQRLSPAEEARTLVANSTVATLATLSSDGHPWGSLVTYGSLRDGSPVLCVSVLAEHGRNLIDDPRASLVITTTSRPEDPLAAGRVTLAGRATRPAGDLEHEARDAHIKAHPAAAVYAGYGDFSIWVLEVQRVRWVGGYGRMDSADADSYHAAEADPVAPHGRLRDRPPQRRPRRCAAGHGAGRWRASRTPLAQAARRPTATASTSASTRRAGGPPRGSGSPRPSPRRTGCARRPSSSRAALAPPPARRLSSAAQRHPDRAPRGGRPYFARSSHRSRNGLREP